MRTPVHLQTWAQLTFLHRRYDVALVQRPGGRDESWFLGMLVPRLSFRVALRWVGLPEPAREPMVHAAPIVRTRLGSLRPA